jgi:putative membrane protein
MKRSIAPIILGSVLFFPFPALAQSWGPRMMWDYGWHGWFLGPIVMILFWGLVIAAIVLVVRGFGTSSHGSQASRTPLDILKERFARGEIDKDEFEERRRVLGN